MRRTAQILGAMALLSAVLFEVYNAGRAHAYGVPTTDTLAYTGSLYTFGAPDNASHTFVVDLFVPPSTTAACTTTATLTTVNGQFTVPLSSACVTVVHQYSNVTVQVTVDTTAMAATPLAAVPYSLEADTASNPAPGSALAMLDPVGTVVAFAGPSTSVPNGWLLCNGQAVSRTTYANLYALISTTAGAGNGSSTFNVPNYQGYFLRGLDTTGSVDPNASTRTAMSSGGATGGSVNTVETAAYQSHTHGISDPGHTHGTGLGSNVFLFWNQATWTGASWGTAGIGSDAALDAASSLAPSTTGVTVQAAGGSETRPLNAAVNYIIKY